MPTAISSNNIESISEYHWVPPNIRALVEGHMQHYSGMIMAIACKPQHSNPVLISPKRIGVQDAELQPCVLLLSARTPKVK